MRKVNYDWTLKNDYPKPSKLNVFGTFVCGGGSTMGYKLAGFNHLGGVEIDEKMSSMYNANHKPKYLYVEDLRDFNKREDLPKELYNLDVLDGSPPCTSFSMAGKREKTWGQSKKFREGQTKQTLDDLVFVYCETIAKLRPKVAILENVPGIIAGKAKGYTLKIVEMLESTGYDVQLFSMNSATMGVPQARVRIFFIARRRDLNLPKIKFNFDLKPISFGEVVERGSTTHKELIPSIRLRWPHVKKGDENLKYADARYRNQTTHTAFFSTTILYDYTVPGTLTSAGYTLYYDEARNLNDQEYVNISSFPVDYNFDGNSARYVCGMSVPPLMIAKIANQIKLQWFS